MWQPRVLWYYTKELLRGRPIHTIQGDPRQLGGDFVVGQDGRLRLAYYSDDPTDRPAVSTLLAAVE